MPPSVPASSAAEPPINLRNLGRVRILAALTEARRLSRAELTRRTGLARATVGAVVADLIRSDIVIDEGSGRAGRTGRPARTLRLNPSAANAVGVDIGRDHVRVVLCDLAGEPVWHRDLHRAAENDPPGVLARIAALVREARADTDVPTERILGIGVGIACPVDRQGTLRADGVMPDWVGVHPAENLRDRTGFDVRLVNDANAGVLAEHSYGAAMGACDVVYIRLSNGIGAGLISAGTLLLGSGGLAGELGHVTVEPHGTICRCGNRGCLETVANPAAIARRAGTTTAELVHVIRQGDPRAHRAIEHAADAVGRALAQAVTILNPELVVIGGELAAVGTALLTPLREAILRATMTSHSGTLRVVPGALDDTACARGAAALVLADAPERLAALATS